MKPVPKLLLIGLLLLLLALPIAMLQGLVAERQQRGREVAADIANASSRAQTVVGPLLRIEFERSVRRVRRVERNGVQQNEEEIGRELHTRLLTPARLQVSGRLDSETRRRGLFEAQVYLADLDIAASFAPFVLDPPAGEVVAQRITGAQLVLAVDDARGLRAVRARVNGAVVAAAPGTALAWQQTGLSLPLDPAALAAPLSLAMELELAGTEALHFVPVGDETQVELAGDWPHPSFGGQFLPTHRQVGNVAPREEHAGSGVQNLDVPGFTARWQVSRLAAQAPLAVRACGTEAASCAAREETFGLRLLDPVDRYLKTERAIKYAWLFVVIVFGALFFLELLRPVLLHPLQYGLTGLALAMFFLLLLSLSEHIGFGPAYAVAALACMMLVGAYLAAPFGSARRAASFALLLGALYGLLYGVLQSEDYALLMGSLALFGLLAAAMLATRRLDWFRLAQRTAPPVPA